MCDPLVPPAMPARLAGVTRVRPCSCAYTSNQAPSAATSTRLRSKAVMSCRCERPGLGTASRLSARCGQIATPYANPCFNVRGTEGLGSAPRPARGSCIPPNTPGLTLGLSPGLIHGWTPPRAGSGEVKGRGDPLSGDPDSRSCAGSPAHRSLETSVHRGFDHRTRSADLHRPVRAPDPHHDPAVRASLPELPTSQETTAGASPAGAPVADTTAETTRVAPL